MNTPTSSVPGIKVPPPLIYISALFIGVGLNRLRPISLMPDFLAQVVGTLLIIASILIMPPVLLRFRRANTPFDVRKAASVLITDGPYRFSRNPGYVSMTLLHIGLGFIFNNAWILLMVLPILLIMNRWIIRREEKHLEEKFGTHYLEYKSIVRRWL